MSAVDDFFAIHQPIPGNGTVYAEFRNGPEASQLGSALQKLEPRFLELTELSSDLRKTDQLRRNWEKALTESLGLSELQSLGRLGKIGFPPAAGNTPPFEGTIKVSGGCLGFPGHDIPFDVKPAYGSGVEMVRDLVEEEVAGWASQIGPIPDCVFRSTGPATQGNPSGLAAQVQAALANLLPGSTYPHSFELTIGASTFSVDLVQPGPLQVHTSWFSLDDKDAAVDAGLRGHLRKKSRQALNLNKSFLLLYVRPNGRGNADLKQSQIENFTH
ncbi:MAG TPA: hypothetical protein VGL56_02555 [Fimbriimonadaceae bacterium]|jgi:hypothetical protein